jgi:hypothetical protein
MALGYKEAGGGKALARRLRPHQVRAIKKFDRFFPDLIAAVSHRGWRPLPVHVSDEFVGLRYFGATFLFLRRTPGVFFATVRIPESLIA